MSRRPARTAAAAPTPLPAWVTPLVLIAAGLIVYANSFNGAFIGDDLGTIVQNPQIRQLSHLGQVLLPPADTPLAGRPLVQLSFAVNYAMHGLDLWGYHAVNLALHLACGILIFLLLQRIAHPALAAGTALLWVVHPLNSEVVNYLTQRTESTMALFFLLTMYFAARNWRAPAVAACVAGMLSKETMVMAPIAVLLFDWAGSGTSSFAELWRHRWKLYLALAATWIVPAAMLVTRGQSLNAGFSTARVSAWMYFLNQPSLILRYLRLALWPSDLVLYYGWPRALTLSYVWLPLLLVTALVVASLIALVKWRRIGAAAVSIFCVSRPRRA